MLMKISIRGMILIVIAILANNLLWLYSSENNDMSDDGKQILLVSSAANNCVVNPVENRKQNTLAQDMLIKVSTSQNIKSTKTSKRFMGESDYITATAEQDSPITLATFDMDVPIELSQDYLYEHTIDREDFFYANRERKLDTIQLLSAQGDDLNLIRKILKTEDNSDIRIEALTRLNHKHSYTATNTLIEALDDPVEEVALTALNTIVTNGDRTLLPLLNEKMNLISNSAMRDKYEKSIHRLKYSVTMGMDEILAE